MKENKTGIINNDAQIHALIDSQVNAIRLKDTDGALAGYSPDVISFDVIDPLQYSGLDSIRKRLEQWFSTLGDSIGFEICELNITAADTAAFSHGLCHVSAVTLAGGKLDMWWRQTVCYRKINGNWMIAHVHSSVPFNTETGKASLDLKPF